MPETQSVDWRQQVIELFVEFDPFVIDSVIPVFAQSFFELFHHF